MPAIQTLKALGLVLQPNQLETPPGSLSQASNIIIRRDDVIESRRGFGLYGTAFGTSTDVAKQLMVYRGRLLRHYNQTLAWDTQVLNIDGQSIFNNFAGSYSEPTAGIRIKNVEANGNLYFTTSTGIQRISAANAGQFTSDPGFIKPAGGIKALDLSTSLAIVLGENGFLPDDSTVAYRVVWGLKDANNNLILGAPSQRSVIYNPLQQMIVRDFMRILYASDVVSGSSALFQPPTSSTFVDSFGDTLNDLASTIRTNMVAYATQLDISMIFADTTMTYPLTIAAGSIDLGSPTNTGVIQFSNAVDLTGYIQNNTSLDFQGFSVSGINVPQTVTSVQYHTDTITSIVDASNYSEITTTSSHGLIDNDFVTITGSDSTPVIDGTYRVTVTAVNKFKVPFTVTSSGSMGTFVNNQLTFSTTATTPTLDITSTTPGTTTTITTTLNHTFTNGDLVQISGVTGTSPSVNGLFTISAASGNTFDIPLTTSGAGSGGVVSDFLITGSSITSNIFRNITEPLTQDSPATHAELQSLQDFLSNILDAMKLLPSGIISSGDLTTYIDPIFITTGANVNINITIPNGITTDYFYQIYRSNITTATTTDILADLVPDDEMRLVLEAFPTDAEITAGQLTVLDDTPDAFVTNSAFLYTNEITGEGILQANDVPPLAQDINRFNNFIFFANTQTKNRLNDTLLGVTNIITDYNSTLHPQITITDTNETDTYNFQLDISQISSITVTQGSTYNSSGTANYFTINDSVTDYYVWFSVGTATDPAPSGFTAIRLNLTGSETADEVANKLSDLLNTLPDSFTSGFVTNTLTVTNTKAGYSTSINATSVPGGFSTSVSTTGKGEKLSKTTQTITTTAATSLASTWFSMQSAQNKTAYYFWYKVSGTGTDPAIPGRTGVLISVLSGDNAASVATKTVTALNTLSNFSASAISNVITVINSFYGPSTAAANGTASPGFSYSVTDPGALQVGLSNSVSPTLATDETAQSLVRVINRNTSSDVYAYYLSTSTTPPGNILFESRIFGSPKFYISANTANTGNSFNPSLAPSFIGISNTLADPTVITTTSPHGYLNNDQVIISNSNSIQSINGVYTISNVTSSTFTIPISIAVAGNTGSVINANIAEASSNESIANRLYYSKFEQPDAVPIVNFIDVGIENKAILRIFPLRQSLFIFKEDGIFRLSGTSALNFQVDLFDTSQILIAPDSVSVANNQIYAWTKTGIITLTESGAESISRPIDPITYPLSSNIFPNFYTATWGTGYYSDFSYIVFTVQRIEDEVATIAYRWCSLTKTWTSFAKTNTCGVVNPVDDKLYLGAGDTDFLEQERKSFTRLDYYDREKALLLTDTAYLNNGLELLFKLETVSNINVGDVIAQNQLLTIYDYNTLLLKLDIDSGLVQSDYADVLTITGGANLRDAIEALATKLDTDAGSGGGYVTAITSNDGTIVSNTNATATVITTTSPHGLITGRIVDISGVTGSVPTINGIHQVTVLDSTRFTIPVSVITPGTGGSFAAVTVSFEDIKVCYNEIISMLNAQAGLFHNYSAITITTPFEVIVENVNSFTNIVKVNYIAPFVQGPMISCAAIPLEFSYSQITMGDALGLKQLREVTMMFQTDTFTTARLSFSTDLVPMIATVDIPGQTGGLFGAGPFGARLFGGLGNSAPFRTYIPRSYQRCRYLNLQFDHKIARENIVIYGVTVTGEVGQSSRAYR